MLWDGPMLRFAHGMVECGSFGMGLQRETITTSEHNERQRATRMVPEWRCATETKNRTHEELLW